MAAEETKVVGAFPPPPAYYKLFAAKSTGGVQESGILVSMASRRALSVSEFARSTTMNLVLISLLRMTSWRLQVS